MKKIFLTTVIFIAINNFCLAQENVKNKKLKPPSRIGGTIGMQIPINELHNYGATFDNGFGFNLFYHYHNATIPNLYLSLNAGYNRYNNPIFWGDELYNETVNEIPITFGLNYFVTNSTLKLSLGLEGGVSIQNGEDIIFINDRGFVIGGIENSERNINWLIAPNVNVFFLISKNILITGNMKFNISGHTTEAFYRGRGINLEYYIGVNTGVAYLLQ